MINKTQTDVRTRKSRNLKMASSSANSDKICGRDKDKMSQSKGNTSIELIKEKMKVKRRKKALNDSNTSWSRRKGTTASFILKASLRSNNQSLAKALAASKHDSQQAHHDIMELQKEKQLLLQQANSTRQAKMECIQRFSNVKQVLTKVSTNLLDVVDSLSHALDLCSSSPLRKSSLGSMPRSSMTSDDDSFGIVQKADQGLSTYCRKAEMVSTAIENAASEMMHAAGTMATATISLSEPPSGTNQSVPPSGIDQSKQVQGPSQSEEPVGIIQSKPLLVGIDQSDQLKDFDSEELNLEFPSLDDVDFPIRFTEEFPDSKGICSSRRQSHLLEAPVKRTRTATLLDPIAIQKALFDDGDYNAEDYDEHDQTLPSPKPKSQPQHPTNAEKQVQSLSTDIQNYKEKSTDKRPVGKSRRVTYNLTPIRSEALGNKTFEVLESPYTPAIPNQPAGGVKDRYVFVHSPPCNVYNYKTHGMELTGVTNNSLSASQDEHNKSLANKSRFNHDEQVIRPWGNIQTEKPGSSSATQAKKLKTKTKLPTNTSKSKLPKPQKKSSKDSSNIWPSKQSKNIKKASKKSSKKATLMSDSFKNDLAVFDLSAGDSFSLPPPVFKRIKSKPNDALSGLGKTAHSDQEPADYMNELSNELQMVNHEEPNHHPVTDKILPELVHQEEQVEPMLQEKLPQPMHQEEHPNHKEEKPDPIQPAEGVNVERGGGIKRKSKKAGSVVTPSIDKAAAGVGRKTKLSAVTAGCDDKDIFDGTYISGPSEHIEREHRTSLGRAAEGVDDASNKLVSLKPKNRRPPKEKKVKAKAVPLPSLEFFVDEIETGLKMPEDDVQHSALMSCKAPPTKTVKSSVTFDVSDVMKNHTNNPTDILGDIDNLCGKKKIRPGKERHSTKKSVKRDASSTSSVAKSSSSSSKIQESESIKKQARDRDSSHQTRRGQKRSADVLEDADLVGVTQEDRETGETGRRSRRGVPVSYKEPSLRDKMRQDDSPERIQIKKKAEKKKVSKRTALETVTNVM